MSKIKNVNTDYGGYVYDVSCDGTFVNALGMNVLHNTDGFNFKLPAVDKFRYTKEHPYIGKGLSRETKEGEIYTGFKADVAEFNDTYMKDFHYSPNAVNKMGLGIDEVVTSTINFSRKNYADYFPEKPFPQDVKMVGNTIKSKKMPEYISKFLEKGIRLLLQDKGQEFLDEYYSYVEKIYNYQIPLKLIASKGKVKKKLSEYIEDCKTLTKAGRPKSRQAWMELAINNHLDVNLGETIYYINTGKSKSHADVKKITHYYVDNQGDLFGGKQDIKVSIEKEFKKSGLKDQMTISEYIKTKHPEITIEDEIVLNCVLLPREAIDSEVDVFCEVGKEYNVPKYVEQFNKRITPLLVCFSPEIRNKILINNPSDKPYFTSKESELCSGFPNKPGDQDTYEQLMTMEDKEIKFWLSHPEWEIPYIKECGMDWDEIVKDYTERMEREKQLGIDNIREVFNKKVGNLTMEDIEDIQEGVLPSVISDLVDIDPSTGNFVSKEYTDIIIGTIYDIYDAIEERINNEVPEEVEIE